MSFISEIENSLAMLAYEGKLDRIKTIVNERNVNARDDDKRTPLHWACAGGQFEVADFLLKIEGIKVNTRDESEWTPLMSAISAGAFEIVQLLVLKGARLTAINETGHSIFHYLKGNEKIAEYLLAQVSDSSDLDVQDHSAEETALHRAASRGDIEVVRLLIKSGADLNISDRKKQTPLHLAYAAKHDDIAAILIEAGASKTKDAKGRFAIDLMK
eukprot:TRINITY_DN26421_c0_g1_i1.p1 TRINITY_DN26421_c0_g1~~TRINITY_DN26421_c0_g1_i1.p1  ORF type:complete len:215 (+),score=55.79 TRINITY_DN26421_c0_g1_i1:130-774(+)